MASHRFITCDKLRLTGKKENQELKGKNLYSTPGPQKQIIVTKKMLVCVE